MSKPLVAITMGDPAGCGAEITVKALARAEIYNSCRPLVIGDAKIIEAAKKITGHEHLKINAVHEPSGGQYTVGTIDVLDMDLVDPGQFAYGKVSAMCGNAAFHYVEKAIQLALSGQVDATVTNALNKEAINLAGHHYDGHTEIYAKLTGTEKYTMMLVHENLRVVHVSTHVSLLEACRRVKKKRVLEVIAIADKACRELGIARPRVGVCGLNPHAGEHGLFGREELDEIAPAIAMAKELGMDVSGPLPPDTAASKALGGWYDILVCMYHDQGHIPLKVLGFVYDKERQRWNDVSGVNITLGLPIIRTSVDHGTAFGHAGTGSATETSLVNAIAYAVQFAERKAGQKQKGERADDCHTCR